MSRKLTRPNPDHPHAKLNRFLQVMRKQYQRATTAEVRLAAAQSWPARALEFPEMTRHQVLNALDEANTAEFKFHWEKKYGWPFDDIYDEQKFEQHRLMAAIEEQKKLNETANTESPSAPPAVPAEA